MPELEREGPDRPGLVVWRPTLTRDEIFLWLAEDGTATGYCGHVDLGTGIATALAQILAEELDIGLAQVRMRLGDTDAVPNQGGTIASETIQVSAVPLRQAAAQARQFLLAQAARRLDIPPARLAVRDGQIRGDSGDNRFLCYADLLAGQRHRLRLDADTPVKPVSAYRIVGQPVARADIEAKARGEPVFVHDVRVPGMAHGRVLRPPYAGIDSSPLIGNSLIALDRSAADALPGVLAVVVAGDFIGVVAEREEIAEAAVAALRPMWKVQDTIPDLNAPRAALLAQPSVPRVLADTGGVDAAIATAARPMPRHYLWPYQMHASIGPSCAVADWYDDSITVWSGTQSPFLLRADLALLLGIDAARVTVIRREAAGCYGRNCADDVSGDAALLSRAVGRPVRVQLTRAQEHAWEPKGAAQLMEIDGGLTAHGEPAAYDFRTRYPSNAAPLLGLLLTGIVPARAETLLMGDRTAIPPYTYAHMRVTVHDMAPIARAAWLRGVSALPNVFAHESYIDELAVAAGIDPIAYRLRYLPDARGRDLIAAVRDRAGWTPRAAPRPPPDRSAAILHGRGFAYALYSHGNFPGTAAAWSAWIADVAVDTRTGEVAVTKVVVGQDSGLVVNPAGVVHQMHGNVIQSASRVLKEQVGFSETAVTAREWGAYPIIGFPELPAIDTLIVPRQDQPPLGVGESASVPSAAAIANAIFDATGLRFREVPFTPERIRAGLAEAGLLQTATRAGQEPRRPSPAAATPRPPRRLGLRYLASACIGAIGIAAAASGLRPAIAPIPRPDASLYAAATIARGKALAGMGNCAGCHTAEDGAPYAGGMRLATPFGEITTTNITPDAETGIGDWSYPAFERAMRQGLHRDGRHLYPAFPYTAFTRTSDADLQALYAYLMSLPPVRSSPLPNALRFPYDQRALLAGWNALFLRPGAYAADPSRSTAWNRGAYLVEGLGHCGGCHTPRNALGAERAGAAHLAGGMAEGWEAPALTSLSPAPIAWSEDAFYAYLRDGYSPLHGTASGPMAAVVRELAAMPDDDIRAIAVYLAAFGQGTGSQVEAGDQQRLAERLEDQAEARLRADASAESRLFGGACAVCHLSGGPSLFGVKPSLALNSNLHSATPDNVIRIVLDGSVTPAHAGLGFMPGFGDHLDDEQIAALIGFLRRNFAPDQPAWEGLALRVARLRRPQ